MLYRKEVTLFPLVESRRFKDPNAIIFFVVRSTKTLDCGVWKLRMFGALRETPEVGWKDQFRTTEVFDVIVMLIRLSAHYQKHRK